MNNSTQPLNTNPFSEIILLGGSKVIVLVLSFLLELKKPPEGGQRDYCMLLLRPNLFVTVWRYAGSLSYLGSLISLVTSAQEL